MTRRVSLGTPVPRSVDDAAHLGLVSAMDVGTLTSRGHGVSNEILMSGGGSLDVWGYDDRMLS